MMVQVEVFALIFINKIDRQMIVRPKFKDHWVVQPDNSQLHADPTDSQLYKFNKWISSCDWQTMKENFYSLIRYLSSSHQQNTTLTKIDTPEQLSQAIFQLETEPYLLIHTLDETRLSYKGFISWLLLANNNNCFLIDVLTLRNYMQSLRNILENSSIFKLLIDWPEVSFSFKRDFGITIINVFDMGCLEAEYECLAQMGAQSRQQTRQELQQSPEIIALRPIKPKMQKVLNRNLLLLLNYATKIPHSTPTTSVNDTYYYQHLFYRYHQVNQSQSIMHFYEHEHTPCLSKQQLDNLNPKRQKLYYSLLDFRDHVGRMYDVSVEMVVPKQVIQKILQNEKISVLQISGFYEESNCTSIGLQLCKRIYDVIQLNEQQFQDAEMLKKQIFEKQVISKKEPNQSFSIKKLLKDIQWGDSNEWLNRKDDVSIKLYKEIISIDQFDYSIGEEYINMMKGEVLKKSQLGKYLKYAQYMRNKNYQKLENLYKMSQLIKESTKIDEFSEETQSDKNLKEQEENSGKKISRQESPEPKSSSSLQEKLSSKQYTELLKIKSEAAKLSLRSLPSSNNVEQSSESRSRKSSETCSINMNELDEANIKRSEIRPLPNSIEQIYQLAQEVKKKADKKVKKKEKKGKNENNKDSDFIPTWEDIQYVMNLANDSLK